MKTFRLYFTGGTSASVDVEAEDLDEAIDAAYDNLPHGICAQCSGWGQKWSRDEGEWEFDEGGYEVDGEYIDGSKP